MTASITIMIDNINNIIIPVIINPNMPTDAAMKNIENNLSMYISSFLCVNVLLLISIYISLKINTDMFY
jgi:hypothetical protein